MLQQPIELIEINTSNDLEPHPVFKRTNTKKDNKLNYFIPEKWDYTADI